jgi:hypothetical protein
MRQCSECDLSVPAEDAPGYLVCWACAMDHEAEDEARAGEDMWVCAWCQHKNFDDDLDVCAECGLLRSDHDDNTT